MSVAFDVVAQCIVAAAGCVRMSDVYPTHGADCCELLARAMYWIPNPHGDDTQVVVQIFWQLARSRGRRDRDILSLPRVECFAQAQRNVSDMVQRF